MPNTEKDIPDWDKVFTDRWRAAIKREFGSGNVAAHRLAGAGVNPATVKAWITKGGRPTIANLCLVARAARDPSAFIVEVCGDEPWARELAVALQRRRLGDAELALTVSEARLDGDPLQVLRALAGPRRHYRFVTDTGAITQPLASPEEGARRMLGMVVPVHPTADHILRDMGWIMIEEAAEQPLVIHCHGIMVSDQACRGVMAWLEQNVPVLGAVVRVFVTDWVSLPCANLYQVGAELARIRDMRDFSLDLARGGRDGPGAGHRPHAERRNLTEAPAAGAHFYSIWEQAGGVVDDAMLQNLTSASLFDLSGLYGMRDSRFRVGFVGPYLRLPAGLTRERITGHDVLEIQASQGFGAMFAAHFALAAYERAPVVHRVYLPGQPAYRRVSFPIFGHRDRKVLAVIGFSDAHIKDSPP